MRPAFSYLKYPPYEEANWRYKMAFAKQLKKNAVGLCNAQAEDFDIEGVVADKLPVRYMLAVHNTKAGKNRPEGKIKYTLKVRSKKQIVEYNMQARLRAEMKLATNLIGNNSLVPMPLTTMEDDSYIYSVFDARLSCLLADYIETKQATGGAPHRAPCPPCPSPRPYPSLPTSIPLPTGHPPAHAACLMRSRRRPAGGGGQVLRRVPHPCSRRASQRDPGHGWRHLSQSRRQLDHTRSKGLASAH